MRITKRMLATVAIGLAAALTQSFSTSSARTTADDDTTDRLSSATEMLHEILTAPDQGVPKDLLDKSACAVVVPNLKKGGFIVGAKYGRGFIVCRRAGGRGWSAPGGVRVEGGSVGFQIGVSETDVLMLVMNESAINKLLSSKFTIGADASATAGPVGRTSSAATDVQLRAEILTYSRSRGLFAGVSLEGATLRPDDDANLDMYGKKMSNKHIVQGTVKPPATASRLIAELNKYSGRRRR